jgi:serine/threonine protein phosphatase PrpC
VLVLCTDGLWGPVHEDEILHAVTSQSASSACAELVKLARERGGPDNITVQVLRLSGNGVAH